MDYGKNPRNIGELSNPDGVATAASKVDGDIATMFLKIENGSIRDVRVKVFGCLAAKAACSIMTELVKDKKVEEALSFTKEDVSRALGGLHKLKMHVATLAEECLHAAIMDYRTRIGLKVKSSRDQRRF